MAGVQEASRQHSSLVPVLPDQPVRAVLPVVHGLCAYGGCSAAEAISIATLFSFFMVLPGEKPQPRCEIRTSLVTTTKNVEIDCAIRNRQVSVLGLSSPVGQTRNDAVLLRHRYRRLRPKWLSLLFSRPPMTQFAKETLPISLEREMRRSYLDYAMSVIVGRPCRMRAMASSQCTGACCSRCTSSTTTGTGPTRSRPVSSGRDRWHHPHGDSAVYDTIVRMAQDSRCVTCWWTARATSVRWTATTPPPCGIPKSAAKIAHEMLGDIDKETVDFGPNYDGSERAAGPASKLPNLLVNGSAGIAVGMATNIPPHNLNEAVMPACTCAQP